MNKPLMVCIGKAGQDVFLEGEVFKAHRENGIAYEHLKLGDKYYVEKATTATGNNAVNASVTFSRQHLPVKLISSVGTDTAGKNIVSKLDDEHVDTSKIRIDSKARTSFSTILVAPSGERTILDYPGSAKILEKQIDDVKGDWLYVSSLGSMSLLKKLLKLARSRGMKIAFNPASYELNHIQECADLLEHVTLFAVNKNEAQEFVDGKNLKELAVNLAEAVEYVLVSDGPRGSVATDGKKLVKAGMYENVPVIDRTGAGDAFTSGFVSQIARGKKIEEAVVFASANSTSVVGQVGANVGVLRSHSSLHEMPLQVTEL
jgi:ribokinase